MPTHFTKSDIQLAFTAINRTRNTFIWDQEIMINITHKIKEKMNNNRIRLDQAELKILLKIVQVASDQAGCPYEANTNSQYIYIHELFDLIDKLNYKIQ